MRKYLIPVIFSLLLLLSAVLVILPADRESITAENREVQSFPKLSAEGLFSGEYTSQLDSYVNDNIGFRGKLMAVSDKIQSCFGHVPYDMGRIVTATADIGIGESKEELLMLYDGKIMEMFVKNAALEERYAAMLNGIKKALPDKIKMYSMLVPTQLEFCPSMYAASEDSQKAAIDSIYGKLDDITSVDVYGKLKDAFASGEEYLYFRTDHHWNMDGAYCGYEAFCEASGDTPYLKNSFRRVETGAFYGSLFNKAKSRLHGDTHDFMFYYDMDTDKRFSLVMRAEDGVKEYGRGRPVFDTENNDYKLFFDGDQPLIEITNKSIEKGKTLIVLKDSYANAMIPWIMNNYKRVVVIDPRSFRGSLKDEIARYNADELLVVNYVFTTTFNDYCKRVGQLIEK